MNRTQSDVKKIIIIMFVLGMIMSFLIPTWQTPDEYNHLWMIGDSIGVEKFADNIEKSIAIERGRIEYNSDEKMQSNEQVSAFFEKPSYSRTEMLPQSISLKIVKHFPATIGILSGILLGIPAYWTLQLGELCSLFFYTFICYQALKIMPVKRNVLAIIMLFPMALQQAGSINYDAVLLPLCFYFIAYVFSLSFSRKKIGWREIFFLIFIMGIIAYIKLPYILFVFLIFIISLDQIEIKIGRWIIDDVIIRKIRIPVLVIGVGLCALVVYLFRDNMWIQIVYGFMVEWKRGLYLLLETGKTWGLSMMAWTVGNLGWLDTPMNFYMVFLVYMAVLVLSFSDRDEFENRKFGVKRRVVTLATGIILSVLVTLSMVNHTIKVVLFGSESSANTYHIREAMYQIPYVGGIQGRYYLPFVPLFFIELPNVIKRNTKIIQRAVWCGLSIVYIYVFWLLSTRYWFV